MDVSEPDEVDTIDLDSMPRRVIVSSYVKQNCKDNSLDPASDFTRFLLSLADKTNVGIHVDRYNSLDSDILDLVSSPSVEIVI